MCVCVNGVPALPQHQMAAMSGRTRDLLPGGVVEAGRLELVFKSINKFKSTNALDFHADFDDGSSKYAS